MLKLTQKIIQILKKSNEPDIYNITVDSENDIINLDSNFKSYRLIVEEVAE